MLWHVVTRKYRSYHLNHLLMLVVLGVYSLLGAICFCALESDNEKAAWERDVKFQEKKRLLARDRLLYDLQYFFVKKASCFFDFEIDLEEEDLVGNLKLNYQTHFQINVSRLLSNELNITLDYYDRMMSHSIVELNDRTPMFRPKWTIWGGLYFAGTVFTTIGKRIHNNKRQLMNE